MNAFAAVALLVVLGLIAWMIVSSARALQRYDDEMDDE